MTRETFEQQLLERLARGELDGIVGHDADMDGITHRAVIISGVPYLVTFPTDVGPREDAVVAEHEFHTGEGKLWFLRNHGWRMQDPDATNYCRTYRRPGNP